MSKPLDFDHMITEGAELWRGDLRHLDAAEKYWWRSVFGK
jgi:hypothetical protein